jgi:hypothetical protein
MVVESRSYKVEILLAIITALSAIIVAIVGNWDKIVQKAVEKQTNNSKPCPTGKPKYKYSVSSNQYNLFIDGALETNKLEKNGWDFEYYSIITLENDSSQQIKINLLKGYTYSISMLTDNTNLLINLSFYNFSELVKAQPGLNHNTILEWSCHRDSNFILFSGTFKEPLVRFGVLILSRKT